MIGKIEITAIIRVLTGMHIGGSSVFSAIGAVDSPVIKDVLTGQPFIPGSSFKGKLRALLAEELDTTGNRRTHNDDPEVVLNLFGAAASAHGQPIKARFFFSYMYIANEADLQSRGVKALTEIKFENTIDRGTAQANPRQIERVLRGATFSMNIIYNIEYESTLFDDFKHLKLALDLLKYDYLGGHGSRGYGRVDVEDISARLVAGSLADQSLAQINEILQ